MDGVLYVKPIAMVSAHSILLDVSCLRRPLKGFPAPIPRREWEWWRQRRRQQQPATGGPHTHTARRAPRTVDPEQRTAAGGNLRVDVPARVPHREWQAARARVRLSVLPP